MYSRTIASVGRLPMFPSVGQHTLHLRSRRSCAISTVADLVLWVMLGRECGRQSVGRGVLVFENKLSRMGGSLFF